VKRVAWWGRGAARHNIGGSGGCSILRNGDVMATRRRKMKHLSTHGSHHAATGHRPRKVPQLLNLLESLQTLHHNFHRGPGATCNVVRMLLLLLLLLQLLMVMILAVMMLLTMMMSLVMMAMMMVIMLFSRVLLSCTLPLPGW